MQNFDYKTLLYYAPPVVILLFVLGYYISFKDIPQIKQLGNAKSQQIIKSEVDLITDAFNQNNFTEANRLAEEILSRDKDNIQALLLKAQNLAQEASLTYREKELGNQAREIALQVLKLDPKNTTALTLIGYTYEIQENYTEAHKYYDMAISIDPYFAKALSQKAHAFILESKNTEAMPLLIKVLGIDPENEFNLLSIGKIYLSQNNTTQAIPIFEKIIKITKNKRYLSDSYYSLGGISEQNDDYAKACSHYRSSVTSDDTSALALTGLARCEFQTNKVEESFETLRKALEINPNQSNAAIQLAIEFDMIGNRDAMKKVLEKLPNIIKRDTSLSPISKSQSLQLVAALKDLK
jgi:tetratricopeptide (TPR) repeat protein